MILHSCNGLDGQAALAEALTHKSGVARIMARASVSSWVEQMTVWFNDEINRPKAEPANIMHALAILQIQPFASICAQLVDAEGHKHVVALYRQLLDDNMLEHMRRTLLAAEKQRGQA